MAVTATGILSLPLENLRTLLAAAAAFQSWVSAADATEAKNRIHLVDLPAPADHGEYDDDELKALMPGAVIDLWQPIQGLGQGQWQSEKVAELGYIDSGKLSLDLFDAVASEDRRRPDLGKLRFMNNVGAVIAAMRDLAGTDTYLVVHRFELWQPMTRVDQSGESAMIDHWRAQFCIWWGV